MLAIDNGDGTHAIPLVSLNALVRHGTIGKHGRWLQLQFGGRVFVYPRAELGALCRMAKQRKIREVTFERDGCLTVRYSATGRVTFYPRPVVARKQDPRSWDEKRRGHKRPDLLIDPPDRAGAMVWSGDLSGSAVEVRTLEGYADAAE